MLLSMQYWENCFAINKWGLVYWKIDRDKVVSECEFSGILLDND